MTRFLLAFVVLLLVSVGCTGAMLPAPPSATPTRSSPTATATASPTPIPTATAVSTTTVGLTEAQRVTLASLEQVDDYPFYVMHYHGVYTQTRASVDKKLLTARRGLDLTIQAEHIEMVARRGLPNPRALPARGLDLTIQAERMETVARRGLRNPRAARTQGTSPDWACSLFAAFGDGAVYGRNFDWEFSPALLLFTDPPDGYASVSMFDLAYLRLSNAGVRALTELSLEDRRPLLQTPFLPFDGMNEHGLAVAMAAVSKSPMPYDPAKPTIGSIGIIRAMLDHARDVDEALALMQQYNVDMEGGPPIHYLIADATGQAALVEFYDGETVVMRNEDPWHLATNFYRALALDSPQGKCRRYDTLYAHLMETDGRLTPQDAMALLADVAQPGTQWSVVYDMTTGNVDVVMGHDFDVVHTFQLALAER